MDRRGKEIVDIDDFEGENQRPAEMAYFLSLLADSAATSWQACPGGQVSALSHWSLL